MNLSSIASSGIVQSEAYAARSASSLVQASVVGSTATDPAQGIVSLQQGYVGVAVGAKVLETGQQLLGSLVDMFA